MIDKFCCMAAIIAAVVLLAMGFSEASAHGKLQKSGTCGRYSIADSKAASAKKSDVAVPNDPYPHNNVDEVLTTDEWMNTDSNKDNVYTGQSVDVDKAFGEGDGSVFFVDPSIQGSDVWKDFKAPSTESVLTSSNIRPFSLTTGMEDSRQSANLGLLASVRDAINPLPKPKLNCDSTICFNSSESHANAVMRQRANDECIS